MGLDPDVLFFFAALGAFNALLLGAYLLFQLPKYPAAYSFLGWLLVALAVRTGFSCLYYFDDAPREFIKLGLSAHLLTGPLCYFFVSFRLTPGKPKKRGAFLHLTGIISLLVVLALTFDFQRWDYTVRYTIHAVLSLYLLATAITCYPLIASRFSPGARPLGQESREVLLFYGALLLVNLGFVISLYTNYIIGPVVFSAIFYAAVAVRFRAGQRAHATLSYKKKLDEQEVRRVIDQLDGLMRKEKMYRDPGLTLDKLARRLGVSRYFLSQMLNDNLLKGYHEFITEHRIGEACTLL